MVSAASKQNGEVSAYEYHDQIDSGGLRYGNRIDSATTKHRRRQNIRDKGIFYHSYSVPCTEEFDYPSQFESVEIPPNFGTPTATPETSARYSQ